MLLHECFFGKSNVARKIANNKPGTAGMDLMAQAVQTFIERGFFSFLHMFFTSLDKTGLETSTLKNKSLTMLIEIIS